MNKYSNMMNEIKSRMDEAVTDTEYARKIQIETNRLAAATTALNHVNAMRNPCDTEATHFKKVDQAARRLQDEAQKAQQRIDMIVQESAADLHKRFEDRCGLRETQYGAEIRSAFKAMNAEDKAKTMQRAIESGDGETMAALTKAPAMLVGLSEEVQQGYAQDFQQKMAPDILNEFESLRNLHELAQSSANIANYAAGDLSDMQKAAEIERAENNSAQANSNFNDALD